MSCDFYELFFFPLQDIIVDYWWLQHLSNWQEAVQTQMEVSQLKPTQQSHKTKAQPLCHAASSEASERRKRGRFFLPLLNQPAGVKERVVWVIPEGFLISFCTQSSQPEGQK